MFGSSDTNVSSNIIRFPVQKVELMLPNTPYLFTSALAHHFLSALFTISIEVEFYNFYMYFALSLGVCDLTLGYTNRVLQESDLEILGRSGPWTLI